MNYFICNQCKEGFIKVVVDEFQIFCVKAPADSGIVKASKDLRHPDQGTIILACSNGYPSEDRHKCIFRKTNNIGLGEKELEQ